jgi:YD repeat-containing protein
MILLLSACVAPPPSALSPTAGCTATERDDTDADGTTDVTFVDTYDPLGRLVERDDGSSAVEWAYDADGHVVGYSDGAGYQEAADYAGPFPLGRTWTYDDGRTGSETWTYDDGLLVEDDLDGVVTTYTYDDARRVSTKGTTDADGDNEQTAYTYSADGLTTWYEGVSADGTLFSGSTVEDTRGNVLLVTSDNGSQTSYTYDDEDRNLGFVITDAAGTVVSRLTVTYEGTHVGTWTYTLPAYAYVQTYDTDGNLAETTVDADGDGTIDNVWTWTHDAQGRVTASAYDDDGDGIPEETTTTTWSCDG